MLLREKALVTSYRTPVSIGLLCMTAFILLNRFGGDEPIFNFLAGLFCGLSIVMNIWGVVLFGSQQRNK